MGQLGGSMIQPKVVPACRFQPLVAQDFLDVPDRAAVEQKLSRRGMPEQVGRDVLVDAGEFAVTEEWPPDVRPFEPILAVLPDEQCWVRIGSHSQVPGDPLERPNGKENRAFLVSLADDSGFAAGKVNVVSIKRQELADAHGRAQ